MRCPLPLAILLLILAPATIHADAFDHYTNVLLAKIPTAEGVRQEKVLTPEMLVEHDRVLPNIKAAFIVVKTNADRFSKLLVMAAEQRIGDKTLPILLIDRFVTYKEGEERTIVAEGRNIRLFQDFHFNLDIGQIVPGASGGDIRLVATKEGTHVEPIGTAAIYLVTKPLPEATPKKSEKVIVGATFEPKYFNGSYKLYDDGRRFGKLVLKLANDGFVDGWFYSDKDGAKYEVTGKVGVPAHSIKLRIQMPKTAIALEGWMFTGDGKAICGVSRIQDRESGFYAASELMTSSCYAGRIATRIGATPFRDSFTKAPVDRGDRRSPGRRRIPQARYPGASARCEPHPTGRRQFQESTPAVGNSKRPSRAVETQCPARFAPGGSPGIE